ncbi:hypothetical protein TrVE_jg4479 [Triparma verrucosa]|uniref:Uncharacterized protein n=1 Tax=Triparma verrucosa TaxID=1606542 RepID=A0A9W7DMU7_9STRA|nr:hypothetical protein TrVE_jg4479 [Triparma verrucosa]
MYRRIPYRPLLHTGKGIRRHISRSIHLERSTSLRIIRPTLICLDKSVLGEEVTVVTEILEDVEDEDGT